MFISKIGIGCWQGFVLLVVNCNMNYFEQITNVESASLVLSVQDFYLHAASDLCEFLNLPGFTGCVVIRD